MFIFTDIETTGLDVYADDILALGIIITRDDFTEVARREWILKLERDIIEDLSPKVVEMHEASGLFTSCRQSRLSAEDVESQAIAFIKEYCPEAAPMAGNSIHFDRAFLKVCMPELEKAYHYRNFDVSTLRLLCHATVPGAKDWKSSRHKAHTPIADLENSLEELAHWRRVLVNSPRSYLDADGNLQSL